MRIAGEWTRSPRAVSDKAGSARICAGLASRYSRASINENCEACSRACLHGAASG